MTKLVSGSVWEEKIGGETGIDGEVMMLSTLGGAWLGCVGGLVPSSPHDGGKGRHGNPAALHWCLCGACA